MKRLVLKGEVAVGNIDSASGYEKCRFLHRQVI